MFAVFNETGLAVKKRTGGAQQPWVSSSPIEGQFYFAGVPTQPSTAAMPSPPAPTSGPTPAPQGLGIAALRDTPRHALRSEKTTLSQDEAKVMTITHNFYRAGWNESGKGVAHQYEVQAQQGGLVVLDHATGLMWQRGGSGTMVQGGVQGAEQYVRALNTKRYGGFEDWRLPTLEEAMSLMTTSEEGQPKQGGRSLNTQQPQEVYHLAPVFEIAGAYFIWTSDVLSPARGWVVYFMEGTCNTEVLQYNAYVRAVRSLHP